MSRSSFVVRAMSQQIRRLPVALSILAFVLATGWFVVDRGPEPAITAVLILAGLLSVVWRDHAEARPLAGAPESSATGSERSLLVMPFVNLSADPHNEYFSDGLTEELIAALAHVDALRVISRYSAMRLKKSERSLGELAEELAVDFIVEGGVRKEGDAIRITTHLTDAARDSELWSERYDGTLEDVFRFQESVAREIVQALHLQFEPGQTPSTGAPEDTRAFEAYLRGRHEMGNWSRDSNERARRSFSTGLEILGENALLHAGLGHASFRLAHIVPGAMARYVDEAAESARRSLEIDPELVSAHVLSGLVSWKKGAISEALGHWRDAVASDPDDTDALTWSAFCLSEVGATDLVAPLLERVVLIDPINPFTRFTEGYSRLFAGDLPAASKAFDVSLSLDPGSTNTITMAAFADLLGGEHASALDRLKALESGEDDVWTFLGSALQSAVEGRPFELPEPLLKDCRKDETFAWFLAECWGLVGRPAEVVEWLDHGLEWGFSNTAFVTSELSRTSVAWDEPSFESWIQRATERREEWLRSAPAPSAGWSVRSVAESRT